MEYVPLCSFDNYIEAHIVLNKLLHYNINCYLKNENTITAAPFLSPALGGMKLMVHPAHIARARDILNNKEGEQFENLEI